MVHIAVTEAAGEDEAPPLDESHGQARDLVARHETADKGRKIVGQPQCTFCLESERQKANGHEERRQERLWLPWCSGLLLDFLGDLFGNQTVRRIITLEKKTSPMQRAMPKCSPIVAKPQTFRVRRRQMKNG